jgi:hypothetical protein
MGTKETECWDKWIEGSGAPLGSRLKARSGGLNGPVSEGTGGRGWEGPRRSGQASGLFCESQRKRGKGEAESGGTGGKAAGTQLWRRCRYPRNLFLAEGWG